MRLTLTCILALFYSRVIETKFYGAHSLLLAGPWCQEPKSIQPFCAQHVYPETPNNMWPSNMANNLDNRMMTTAGNDANAAAKHLAFRWCWYRLRVPVVSIFFLVTKNSEDVWVLDTAPFIQKVADNRWQWWRVLLFRLSFGLHQLKRRFSFSC